MEPLKAPLRRTAALVLVGLLVMLAFPTRTAAHCISSDDQANFDPGPIPVWISTDTGSGLYHVGLGDDYSDIEVETRWVKAAIDIINSSSADTPRLYFAGYDPSVGQWNQGPYDTVNAGITINAYSCATYPPGGGIAHTWFGGGIYDNRVLISFIRSRLYDNCPSDPTPCDWLADPLDPDCEAYFVDPNDIAAVDGDYDFTGVLVHELLHALGLNHTDWSSAEWTLHCQNSYDPALASVMHTGGGFSLSWRHRLRRDDIEGLRELYGEPQRQVYAAGSTQTIPTSWSSSTAVATVITNTPAGLTTHASPDAPPNVYGSFTNTSDRLRYFYWSQQDGWYAGNFAVYSNGSTPITTHEKTAASAGYPISGGQPGPLRVMFAWVGGPNYADSGEDVMDPDMRVWYRIWNGFSWQNVGSSGYTTYKNYGVALCANKFEASPTEEINVEGKQRTAA